MKEKLDFEIDTGIEFGTGSHPTTVLCLNLIERCLGKGDKVLDVGTSSGILMIHEIGVNFKVLSVRF